MLAYLNMLSIHEINLHGGVIYYYDNKFARIGIRLCLVPWNWNQYFDFTFSYELHLQDAAITAIENINLGGVTNLGAGLCSGFEQFRTPFAKA